MTDQPSPSAARHAPDCVDGSKRGAIEHCPPPWPQPEPTQRPNRLGVLVHRFSDWLHLLAHRLINDPEWRMRNG